MTKAEQNKIVKDINIKGSFNIKAEPIVKKMLKLKKEYQELNAEYQKLLSKYEYESKILKIA
jgi:hypothetical protein